MFVRETLESEQDPIVIRRRSAVRQQVEVLLLRLALFASFAFIAAICLR